MELCPFCDENMTYASAGTRDARSVNCPRCGRYSITRSALVNLRSYDLSLRQKANISGWLRENPEFELSTANIEQISHLPSPSFHEQADKFLLSLEKNTSYAGEYIEEKSE